MLKKFWKESVAVIKEKDPAFKSAIEVLLYPSFWAVVNHRIAHSLYKGSAGACTLCVTAVPFSDRD